MRGDMTQVGVVTTGQGVIDERKPGERFRGDLVEQIPRPDR